MMKKLSFSTALLMINIAGIVALAIMFLLNVTTSSNGTIHLSHIVPSAKLIMYGYIISIVFSFATYLTAIFFNPVAWFKVRFLNKVFILEFFGFLIIFSVSYFFLVRF